MNILEATRRYEAWLAARTFSNPRQLLFKHDLMKENVFAFLRATFYRWIQLWPEICPNLDSAPTVLAVADLHVENFGTWRDAEGRLIWGVNDFDEAFPLPYTHDLVRLTASAIVAISEGRLTLKPRKLRTQFWQATRKALDQQVGHLSWKKNMRAFARWRLAICAIPGGFGKNFSPRKK